MWSIVRSIARRVSEGDKTRTATTYLGLGTNVGDREANLREGLRRLRDTVRINAISSVYRSEPVGFRNQPDFWNLVVRASTELEPNDLLGRVKEIERAMGRRKRFRGAPRVMDIDILLYGRARVRTRGLELPHPRMLKRGFVLRPLAEIDPEIPLPPSGVTVGEALADAADSLEDTERLFPGGELLG